VLSQFIISDHKPLLIHFNNIQCHVTPYENKSASTNYVNIVGAVVVKIELQKCGVIILANYITVLRTEDAKNYSMTE